MIESYPLTWPTGWPRTSWSMRRHGAYKVDFLRARDEAVREIKLLGGREAVLSTNIPTRRDGIPYAGQREPDDPGVAVYWTDRKNKQRVIACDAWKVVRHNIRAIGLAVEGLRAIQRAGASEILDRAFTGFAALPAPSSGWRRVLGFDEQARPARDVIEARYRELAKAAHPDVAGGSHEAMLRLNTARDEALRATM